jgi:PAS domain S-box-containing protein
MAKSSTGTAICTKEQSVAEPAPINRLHQLSTRLLATAEWQALLEEILDATMALLNADFGTLQFYDAGTGGLRIVAQRGFHRDFLEYFDSVHESTSCCGAALERRERVIIEDVLAEPFFAPHVKIATSAGYRAVQSTPLSGRNGEPLGMISTHFRRPHRPSQRELEFLDLYARQAAELIERKRAEEALRASEERSRRYFELGLIGMATTSPTQGILEVNDELCRILGYERNELLKKAWAEITHPDDLAADAEQFNHVMAGEVDGYTLDKRWIRNDGRVIHSIMSAKCQRRADGSVDYFVALVQDITERKRVEEEQRELAALVENSPDFIGIASLEGRVSVVNPAGRSMVGLDSPAQVNQTRLLDYVAEEDRETVQRQILPLVMLEGQWEGETRFRHFKTGALMPVRQHIFLIREPRTDRPVAVATIVRDITEPKRSAEALRTTQTQLAHMARVTTMGELAASIAHEVNQPLAAVVTNSDAGLRWLSQTPPNVDEARIAIKEVVRQGHRASNVIARIRDLVRKGPPNISAVDMNELIEELLVLTRQQAAEHGVTVGTELAADIPLVFGDSVQLQQVLVNLLLNAIEATSARKDGAREVLLASQRHGTSGVVIAVHDSGIGIAPQHADQLFRPFFTTKPTGIGMGLAISRSIIEAHGGRLWATSNQNLGAIFQFTLPVRGPATGRRAI